MSRIYFYFKIAKLLKWDVKGIVFLLRVDGMATMTFILYVKHK